MEDSYVLVEDPSQGTNAALAQLAPYFPSLGHDQEDDSWEWTYDRVQQVQAQRQRAPGQQLLVDQLLFQVAGLHGQFQVHTVFSPLMSRV